MFWIEDWDDCYVTSFSEGDFWRALSAIYVHFDLEEKTVYSPAWRIKLGLGTPEEITQAMVVVDDWLTMAKERGWMFKNK